MDGLFFIKYLNFVDLADFAFLSSRVVESSEEQKRRIGACRIPVTAF